MSRPFMSWHRLLVAITVTGAVMIAVNPALSLHASAAGLQLWFTVVLPALFPYFVITELLLAYGVIDLLGTVLHRIMRRLFRLPGEAGFALAISIMSGTPVGARVVAGLRQQNKCTRDEGERLLAFANTASPLFIMGAVAAGMFQWPKLGIALAVSHYIGALCVGLVMRFSHVRRSTPTKKTAEAIHFSSASWRGPTTQSWGTAFSNAVRTAMQSQLLIGGSMMFFSVVAALLTHLGADSVAAAPLAYVGSRLGISEEVFPAIITGIVEVTLGLKQLADSTAPVTEQIVAASLILGWSGFSIHAQVIAMIQGTDLRYKRYVLGRIVHAATAAMAMWQLLPWLNAGPEISPVMGIVAHPALAPITFTVLPAVLLVASLTMLLPGAALCKRIMNAVFRLSYGRR